MARFSQIQKRFLACAAWLRSVDARDKLRPTILPNFARDVVKNCVKLQFWRMHHYYLPQKIHSHCITAQVTLLVVYFRFFGYHNQNLSMQNSYLRYTLLIKITILTNAPLLFAAKNTLALYGINGASDFVSTFVFSDILTDIKLR